MSDHISQDADRAARRSRKVGNPGTWSDEAGLGNRTSTVYDADGRAIASINPLSYRTTTVYDLDGRAIAQLNPLIDPLLRRSTFSYDAAGRRIRSRNALDQLVTSVYTRRGDQQTAVVNPLLQRTTSVYDQAGRVIAVRDANNRRPTTVYDAAGRTIALVNPNAERTTTVYSAAGERTALVDARAHRTTFVYDDNGHEVRSLGPLLQRTTLAYDAAGQQTLRIDPRGVRTTYCDEARACLDDVNSHIADVCPIEVLITPDPIPEPVPAPVPAPAPYPRPVIAPTPIPEECALPESDVDIGCNEPCPECSKNNPLIRTRKQGGLCYVDIYRPTGWGEWFGGLCNSIVGCFTGDTGGSEPTHVATVVLDACEVIGDVPMAIEACQIATRISNLEVLQWSADLAIKALEGYPEAAILLTGADEALTLAILADAARKGELERALAGLACLSAPLVIGVGAAAIAGWALRKGNKPLHRPYLRKATVEEVERRAPRTPDGRPIDPNTLLPIEGKPDLGHKHGHEFWREKQKAEAEGLTQAEFNDRMNNPDLYQLEDPSSNQCHRYELK